MVCVVCNYCMTSPYREVCRAKGGIGSGDCMTSPYREVCRAKGGIGSGETLCHDIYPARPVTTVFPAANTYCMMDSHSSCTPRTVVPRVQFSGACEQSH